MGWTLDKPSPEGSDEKISLESDSPTALRDSLLAVTFLIYTVLWEAMVWIGGVYVMLSQGWPIWSLLIVWGVSSIQFQPHHWRQLYYPED